ncbi:MAG: hypothetical protein IJT76_04395 [Clostridia bacterium]|nr:hypothetical protein [Clostridia bacterium]
MEKPARRGIFAAPFSSGKWNENIKKGPVFKEKSADVQNEGWEIVPNFELCIVPKFAKSIVKFKQKYEMKFSDYSRKSNLSAG